MDGGESQTRFAKSYTLIWLTLVKPSVRYRARASGQALAGDADRCLRECVRSTNGPNANLGIWMMTKRD